MTLKQLQQHLLEQTLGNTLALEFIEQLRPCGELAPKQQILIYQQNAFAARQTVLLSTYAVCVQILGERYFKHICKGYIYATPSTHIDLNLYGETFPDYLAEQLLRQEALKDFPYLPDLALLEWHFHRLFFVANVPEFDFAAFAHIETGNQHHLQFHLAESCFFMPSDFPVLSLWRSHKAANPTSTMPAGDEYYCIYRQQGDMLIDDISSDLFTLLQGITQGWTLGTMCQHNLDSLLPQLIEKGWVSRFSIAHV